MGDPRVDAHRLHDLFFAAGDGHRLGVDLAGADQLADHGRHAAGAVVAFAEVLAGRLAVHQQGNVVAIGLPVLDHQVDADVPGNGVEVVRDRTSKRLTSSH